MHRPASFQEEYQMSWSVLIVDDEPMTQDLLRLMLEPAGFRVTGADHGLEALQGRRPAEFKGRILPHVGITEMNNPEHARFRNAAVAA